MARIIKYSCMTLHSPVVELLLSSLFISLASQALPHLGSILFKIIIRNLLIGVAFLAFESNFFGAISPISFLEDMEVPYSSLPANKAASPDPMEKRITMLWCAFLNKIPILKRHFSFCSALNQKRWECIKIHKSYSSHSLEVTAHVLIILVSDTNCQISVNMTFTKWARKEEQRCTHFINTGGRQRLNRERKADDNFPLNG